MKVIRNGAILCVLALILACSSDEQPVSNGPSYGLLDGGEIRLSELQGKVVFINYWAEWCSPCREEIPELNALHGELAEQVVVLGVNFDGFLGNDLQQQVTKMGIEFPQLVDDPREHLDVAPSGVLPETLVIDRRGEFQQVLLGPQSLKSLRRVVASMPEEMMPGE